MSAPHLTSLVAEFCKSIGLPELVPSDDDYYSFSVDDSLIVEIKYESDSDLVCFFVQLGFIDAPNKDEIIEDILDANVLWRGTGGVTLGRDSATGIVTLAYQERIEHITYPRFEEILETVISSAQVWAARIKGETPDGTEGLDPASMASMLPSRA